MKSLFGTRKIIFVFFFCVIISLNFVQAPGFTLAQAKEENGQATLIAVVSSPQFFALSVANLDESVTWYQNNLGLNVAKTINSPDGKVRVVILKSNNLVVELLQNKESIPNPKPKDIYLVQGIFKVGFSVPKLDELVKELKLRKIVFETEIIESKDLNLKFVLIRDNSGNILQIFQRLNL